jgi:hypothetical protein
MSTRKLAKWIRRVIIVFTTIPGLWFLWLHFADPFAKLVRSVPATIIGEFAMAVYLAGWVGGMKLELEWQEEFVPEAPSPGKTILSAVGAGALLLAFFVPMCLLVERGWWTWAFAVLIGFWTVNAAGWQFGLVRLMTAQFKAARRAAGANELLALRIGLAMDHVVGPWQRWRFGAGAVLAVACVVTSRTPLPALLAGRWHLASPEVLLATLLLVFVVAMEAWIWVKRVVVIGGLAVLDDLEERGALARARDSARAD